jgi:hypothetical protein
MADHHLHARAPCPANSRPDGFANVSIVAASYACGFGDGFYATSFAAALASSSGTLKKAKRFEARISSSANGSKVAGQFIPHRRPFQQRRAGKAGFRPISEAGRISDGWK